MTGHTEYDVDAHEEELLQKAYQELSVGGVVSDPARKWIERKLMVICGGRPRTLLSLLATSIIFGPPCERISFGGTIGNSARN